MRKLVLIDLGGCLMLPEPSLEVYLEEGRMLEAPGNLQWAYVTEGIRSGAVIPKVMDGVEDAVGSLAEKYALGCFSDAPEEFKRACLGKMPSISRYFPEGLMS